jgi:arginyl-tRNA synthetase
MDELQKALTAAFQNLGLDSKLAIIASSNLPDLCDYQCNGALSAAKILKQSPMKIAQDIVGSLNFQDYELTVVSPGFINIKLLSPALIAKIKDPLSVVPQNNKVIVDFGSPNVAKGMHVGHLRSTLIGAALVLIHRFAGNQVVGDNHLGDWGTPLGIVITKIKKAVNFNWTIEEIESLYIEGSKEYKTNPDFKENVLETTKLLQQGNMATRIMWQNIVDVTITALKADYKRLGISFDLWNGESTYEKYLPKMVESLAEKGFSSISTRTESKGVTVIDIPNEQPFLLTKSDGGFLYSTTDLACLMLRAPVYDKILYVVDKRQGLHFNQLFLAGEKVGYLTDSSKVSHVAFGTINGADGKPFKTRDGDVLKLKELIAQVFYSAETKIKSSFTEEEKNHNLPIIAVGALKFAELKHNRLSDYVFDLDQFMKLDGFTGPYVMYSAVRAKSVLAKTDILPELSEEIYSSSERLLAFTLGRFKEYYLRALNFNEPHHLCEYAYAVANAFNGFYHNNSILQEPDKVKQKKYLWMTVKTLETLELTLSLLGIQIPDKM